MIFPVSRLALLRQSLAKGQLYPAGIEKVAIDREILEFPNPNFNLGVSVIKEKLLRSEVKVNGKMKKPRKKFRGFSLGISSLGGGNRIRRSHLRGRLRGGSRDVHNRGGSAEEGSLLGFIRRGFGSLRRGCLRGGIGGGSRRVGGIGGHLITEREEERLATEPLFGVGGGGVIQPLDERATLAGLVTPEPLDEGQLGATGTLSGLWVNLVGHAKILQRPFHLAGELGDVQGPTGLALGGLGSGRRGGAGGGGVLLGVLLGVLGFHLFVSDVLMFDVCLTNGNDFIRTLSFVNRSFNFFQPCRLAPRPKSASLTSCYYNTPVI